MIKISKELKAVIQSSWFTIENGLYVYAKVTNVHTSENSFGYFSSNNIFKPCSYIQSNTQNPNPIFKI